ncbi:P-loop containing nucleoside triphosphate hydrolase protein [Morchella snyderi]|nr:P-loop containing nucleoside triphosphate hydrolase protein [Morchella snyderi]
MNRRPLIQITSATFHHTPTSPALFPNLTLTLPPLSASPSSSAPTQKWTILGPSKTLLLSILSGTHTPRCPQSRTYPALAAHAKWPQDAIGLVSFGAGARGTGMLAGGTGGGGEGEGYAASRYESLREEFDLTLLQWLEGAAAAGGNLYEHASAAGEGEGEGEVEVEAEKRRRRREAVASVAERLQLGPLLEQSVMTLSNGQARRARIAQALLRRPEVLLVDEPFMGLDPIAKRHISSLLDSISSRPGVPFAAQVVCGLRLQDAVPEWSTHLAYAADNQVHAIGEKGAVVEEMARKGLRILLQEGGGGGKGQGGLLEKVWAGVGKLGGGKEGLEEKKEGEGEEREEDLPEKLIEMKNVRIAYYGKEILKDFSWTIRRGEKWGLFGPNGSGKTTLISLITSDHPQTYSLPITHFGKPRLPTPGTPGTPVTELQRRIGHSSPEIHAFFPRHLSLRRAVLSGYADAPLAPPVLTRAQREGAERWMRAFDDVVVAGGGGWEVAFGEAGLCVQRLALFLRAVVPRRDVLVMDEAFSGMEEAVRDRCLRVLEGVGGRVAVVVVSHDAGELPAGVGRWVRLVEGGGRAVFGVVGE